MREVELRLLAWGKDIDRLASVQGNRIIKPTLVRDLPLPAHSLAEAVIWDGDSEGARLHRWFRPSLVWRLPRGEGGIDEETVIAAIGKHFDQIRSVSGAHSDR